MTQLIDNMQTHLNCFFDKVPLRFARYTHGDMERRNAIFFDVTGASDNSDDINPMNPVYRNQINAFMEYQLHMAQHLQYHVVNGTKTLFDPMTRKQLFRFTTNIYRGVPILQGLDRNVFVQNDVTGNPKFVFDTSMQFGIQKG
jgi:hypothetical protein